MSFLECQRFNKNDARSLMKACRRTGVTTSLQSETMNPKIALGFAGHSRTGATPRSCDLKSTKVESRCSGYAHQPAEWV